MKAIVRSAVILLLVVGAGAAWYLGSPLFIDRQVMEAAPDSVELLASGEFTRVDNAHWASGTASIYRHSDGALLLRFEEGFEGANGPDLRVVLAPHPEPRDSEQLGDYLDLGELRGNIGSQNYEIPRGTSVAEYQSVVIYCRAFSVVFSTAEMISAEPTGTDTSGTDQ